MHREDYLKRPAASAAVFLIPLVLLLVGLVVRLAQPGGRLGARPAALDFSMDVTTAVRWLVVAGMLSIGGLAVAAALRRR
jgi:uncharacterized membrane protein YtjA (UPF0391 family)